VHGHVRVVRSAVTHEKTGLDKRPLEVLRFL
jgi:hypothetical protein